MTRIRFGALGALALAAASLGSVGGNTPAATSRAAEVSAQLNGTKAPVVPTIVQSGQSQNVVMRGGFIRYFQTSSQIWNGVEKRGSRRGRSRFNYNR